MKRIISALIHFYYRLYRFSMPYTRNKEIFYIIIAPNKPQGYRTSVEEQDLSALCVHLQGQGYHVYVRQ